MIVRGILTYIFTHYLPIFLVIAKFHFSTRVSKLGYIIWAYATEGNSIHRN